MARTRDNLTLKGDDALRRLLKALPLRVAKRGLRAAMTAAAAPIVRQAKARAAKQSGTLKKAITRKVKTYRTGNVAVIIGARRDKTGTYKGAKRVPANYYHLVEAGTKAHAIRRKNGQVQQHPGAQANPTLAPAYRSNKGASRRIAAAKLKETVEREALKLKGKA